MRFAIAAVALAFASSAQALALQPIATREPTRVEIPVGSVDFRNPQQVDRLYQRMQRAARQACHSRIANRAITETDRACARDALNRSVAQLSRPMLTARHAQNGTAFATGWR